MARKWIKAICPAQAHDMVGLYSHTMWLKQMDRCWESDDGFEVCSRLLDTEWGKVEHATIQRVKKNGSLTANGEADIPWKIKQEIKDELFGKKRMAIEVFPDGKHLIDQCDVYHLWVFEKGFKLPFGIHPKDEQAHWHSRGFGFTPEEAKELQQFLDERDKRD